MPVIYMTGTHSEQWASKGVPNSVLLAKPFAPAQLVTAISKLLNTGGCQRSVRHGIKDRRGLAKAQPATLSSAGRWITLSQSGPMRT